ncbi:hypothetical protein NKG05_15115 [Oerskovia sp. M15]
MLPPRLRQYTNPLTWEWSRTIDSFDGFVIVTPSTTTHRAAC